MMLTRSATAKIMATMMPAVETLEPESADLEVSELVCAGIAGGVARGAADVEESNEEEDEDADEDEEDLLVVDVEIVVWIKVGMEEEALSGSEELIEVRVDLVVLVSPY